MSKFRYTAQQIKLWMKRSKIRSTDQKLDQ